MQGTGRRVDMSQPPSSQRRVLGNVKNVAASTPLSTMARDQMKSQQVKPRMHSTATPATCQASTIKRGSGEGEGGSEVPPDHTERDTMCTYLPLKDTYDDLIDDGPPECMCELYDDFTNSFPNEPEWSLFDELDDPKFYPLWSDEKRAVVPPDHTERDMMCTYLPPENTYDDLIDAGPPECMCELYDDFTNSYPNEPKWGLFDELDDPKTPLRSDASTDFLSGGGGRLDNK